MIFGGKSGGQDLGTKMDASAATSSSSPRQAKGPVHFEDPDGLFKTVCRWSMTGRCTRKNCQRVHDKRLCRYYWRTGQCRDGDECKRNHFVTLPSKSQGDAEADKTDAEDAPSPAKKEEPKKDKKPKNKDRKPKKKEDESAKEDEPKASEEEEPKDKPAKKEKKPRKEKEDGAKPKVKVVKGKNTEVFEPSTKPVDLRITYDLGAAADKFTTSLTSRDVLLAPNVFSDFKKGELYAKLLSELNNCGIPEERLLKMWHGNDKIDGTHLIADDKTRWKNNCPTFQLVIDRLAKFFSLKVQATRFNWYKDTSQWKPFHFDAAAVKPEIAAKQNFTIGVSFGATRDAAFEHAQTRTVVSVPQPDGCVYAFARDTNIIWRHGILQDTPVRNEGRISVIAWGWIDGMVDAPDAIEVAPVLDAKVRK